MKSLAAPICLSFLAQVAFSFATLKSKKLRSLPGAY
jgi:hypothetical protein